METMPPQNRAERRASLRQGHSPEQMAKWAAEREEREHAQASAREKEREAEKLLMSKRAAAVDTSAFGQNFTTDEKDSIKQYYLSGDWRGAQAEGREAAVSAIERALRAKDIEIELVSLSNGERGEGKSIYAKVGSDVVRISDHELPGTARRNNDRAQGLTGKWDREVIVTDWHSRPLEEYLGDVLYGHLETNLPPDWNGRIQVQGCVFENKEIDTNKNFVVAAEAVGRAPEFWGVYAQLTDGTHAHIEDFESEEQARQVAERLRGLHREPCEKTRDVADVLTTEAAEAQRVMETSPLKTEAHRVLTEVADIRRGEHPDYRGLTDRIGNSDDYLLRYARNYPNVAPSVAALWSSEPEKYSAASGLSPERVGQLGNQLAKQAREREAVQFAVQSIQRQAAAKGHPLSTEGLEQASRAVQERFARDPGAIEKTLQQRQQYTAQAQASQTRPAPQTSQHHAVSPER